MKNSVFLITVFLLMSSVNFQINAQFDKLKKSVDKSVAGLSKTIKTAGDTKTTSTPATTSEREKAMKNHQQSGVAVIIIYAPTAEVKMPQKKHRPKI